MRDVFIFLFTRVNVIARLRSFLFSCHIVENAFSVTPETAKKMPLIRVKVSFKCAISPITVDTAPANKPPVAGKTPNFTKGDCTLTALTLNLRLFILFWIHFYIIIR